MRILSSYLGRTDFRMYAKVDKFAYYQFMRRIERAEVMYDGGYILWGRIHPHVIYGKINSQQSHDKNYYSFLHESGTYYCYQDNFSPCLGIQYYNTSLKSGPCKHILALVIKFSDLNSKINCKLIKWVKNSLSLTRNIEINYHVIGFIQQQYRAENNEVRDPFNDLKTLNDLNALFVSKSETNSNLDKITVSTETVICSLCKKIENRTETDNWKTCYICLSLYCIECYWILQQENIRICLSGHSGFSRHSIYETLLRH